MNEDGTGRQAVTTDTLQDYVQPAWSPDGGDIAFTSYFPEFSDDPFYDYSESVIGFYIYENVSGGAGGGSLRVAHPAMQTSVWFSSYGAFFWAESLSRAMAQEIIAPPDGALCPSVIDTTGGINATVRISPSETAAPVKSIPDGSPIGLYGTNNSNTDTWYYIRFTVNNQETISGWVKATLIEDVSCNLPGVDNGGATFTPVPPTLTPTVTPTPDPLLCVGMSIFPDHSLIRDIPTDINSNANVVASFGNLRYSEFFPHSFNIQITARYTANTPQQFWDDWYKVQFDYIDPSSGQNEQVEGWASAQVTTLRPSYRHFNCVNLVEYRKDETTNQLIETPFPPSGFLPTEPSPIPPAVELFQHQQELLLPAPFTRLPVDDGAAFSGSEGYGLNTFAYQNPNNYEGVNHVHSGLDFSGTDDASPIGCVANVSKGKSCIRVTPICDGIVIKRESNENTNNTGARITYQCFTPEGSRSNIFVTYSHLQDTGNLDGVLFITAGQNGGEDGLSLNVFQYQGNNFPHLHLEVLFDLDGDDLNDAIRINPLLLFDNNTAQIIAAEMGPFYPVDFEQAGQKFLFEWNPPDTNDPVEVQQQPFDGVTFNNRNQGHLKDDQLEDMDLGIQLGELGFFSIVADVRELASGQASTCTYVWGRTDQLIVFRYQGNESCAPLNGIQIIPTPPASGYNGPEVLSDRWVINVSDLVLVLLEQ